MTKYVFVTGGVVSGLGKGITAASLGRLLKSRGINVTMQKFDPYLNVDPGTMNPIQHGEVFVTDDGTETDLDLGHYERFIDENLDSNSNVTSGKIYWSVLNKERHGDYGGGTVQVIPHITNEIKSRFYREKADNKNTVAIIEVGGTVGDIESQPFYEAIRQFMLELGSENVCNIHVTLIPYLFGSEEMKSKPTQASVRELQRMGIRADIIVCRSERPLTRDIRDKLALFCNVPNDHVLQNLNASSIYEVPLMLEKEKIADVVCSCLKLDCPSPDLSAWKKLVDDLQNPKASCSIAIVGKYTKLHDAYLSVVEALHHGGIENRAKVDIRFIESEELEKSDPAKILEGIDGILIPGGFGIRGTEGMIKAADYARKNNIPYLGICLGMQIAVISFARSVLGFNDAHSAELDPSTTHPVIDLMPEQKGVTDRGGTMRLGAYPCILKEGTLAYRLYGKKEISERHRHRYELNNEYRDALNDHGMIISGTSPDERIAEMAEIKDHPFYIGTQAHPEFRSRPNKPHPLFSGLIKAALDNKGDK